LQKSEIDYWLLEGNQQPARLYHHHTGKAALLTDADDKSRWETETDATDI
jgi:hypothetical protein